jgi:peptide/nickel transport system permease protein
VIDTKRTQETKNTSNLKNVISKIKLDRFKKLGNLVNINYPLILGSIIMLSLLVTIFFPRLLTDRDPYKAEPFRVRYPIVNGEPRQRVEFPPLAPNSENILGTDDLGRDNYSRLVYGAKTTLFACIYITLMRFLVALPMGIWAGLGGKIPKFLIRQFSTIFTAIPPLIACFVVLNLKYIASLSMEESIKAFAIVFTVVGWAKLASSIEQRAFEIYQEEFIEGKIAIGRSKLTLSFQTILPHLIPSITSFFFLEAALILFLAAQLSIFYVFLGPRLAYSNDVRGDWFLSAEPEWSSMLSRASTLFKQGKYLPSVVPALAFTYAIMGLNLLGEGLRIEFDKRTSLVVTWLSRIPSIMSPKIFVARVKRYKSNKRAVWTTATIYIVIAAILLVPPPKSKLQFQISNVLEHMRNLSSEELDVKITGTKGGYLTAQYLADQLADYGIEPLLANSYFQDFPLSSSVVGKLIENAVIEIGDKSFNLWDDFLIQTIYQDWIYDVLDFEEKDEEKDEDQEEVEEPYKTVVINVELVDFNLDESSVEEGAVPGLFSYKDPDNPMKNIIWDMNGTMEKHKSNTMFLEANAEKFDPSTISIDSQSMIWINSKVAQHIKETGANKISLKLDVRKDYYKHYGRNVFGVIRGSNTNADKKPREYLMVGTNYDRYIPISYVPSASDLSSVAISLETARALAQLDVKPDHDVVFVFWDGDYAAYEKHENTGYMQHGLGPASMLRDQLIYYIDIGPIGGTNARQILYRTDTPPVRPEGGFDFISYLRKRISELDISSNVETAKSSRYVHLINKNSFNIHFSAMDPTTYGTGSDTIKNINKDIVSKFGQLLLDIMINHSYRGKI